MSREGILIDTDLGGNSYFQNISFEEDFSITFDGTNYFLAIEEVGKIIGKRVSDSAVIIDTTGTLIKSGHQLFDLVYDDLNYLMLSADFINVFVTKISSEVEIIEKITLSLLEKDIESPVMTYGKEGLSLIAYSYQSDSTSKKQIKTLIFNSHPTEIVVNKSKTPAITINICNGMVKVTFTTNINSNAQLAIFDISGKLVRVLDTETGIGKQTVVWNGFDNNSAAVSNGCYIIKIQIADEYMAKHFIFSR